MSDTSKKIVKYGAIVLGIVLLIVFALRFFNAAQSYNQRMAEADNTISQTQKEILSENAKLEEADKAAQDSKSGVYNMKDPGVAVANLQTKMSIMPVSIKRAKQENLQEAQDNLYNARNALSEYFSDGESRVWFPANITTAGRIVWKCVTTYDIKQVTLPCVWVCYEGTDDTQLLAYAYADYDVETNLFSNVSIFVTYAGTKMFLEGGDS